MATKHLFHAEQQQVKLLHAAETELQKQIMITKCNNPQTAFNYIHLLDSVIKLDHTFFVSKYTLFFFQAEDGIRDVEWSRGLGDVYKRQIYLKSQFRTLLNALPDNGVPSDLLAVETDETIDSDDDEPDLSPPTDNPSEDTVYNESTDMSRFLPVGQQQEQEVEAVRR